MLLDMGAILFFGGRECTIFSGITLDPDAIQTNIVIFEWTGGPAPDLISRLGTCGVKVSYTGGAKVRMVTHAGIGPTDVDAALEVTATVDREALQAARML